MQRVAPLAIHDASGHTIHWRAKLRQILQQDLQRIKERTWLRADMRSLAGGSGTTMLMKGQITLPRKRLGLLNLSQNAPIDVMQELLALAQQFQSELVLYDAMRHKAKITQVLALKQIQTFLAPIEAERQDIDAILRLMLPWQPARLILFADAVNSHSPYLADPRIFWILANDDPKPDRVSHPS